MKICSACKKEKSLLDFYRRSRSVDGLQSHCKSCDRIKCSIREKANPDKKKSAAARYRARYPHRVTEWAKKNPERNGANKRRWEELNRHLSISWEKKNPEKRKVIAERYRKNHPEISREKSKRWAKNNRPKRNAMFARYMANRLKATPAWANEFFIEEAYDLAARRSALKTGGHSKWHVDHIVPLQSKLVCGLHVHNNLQVIPAYANQSKSNRYWPDMP